VADQSGEVSPGHFRQAAAWSAGRKREKSEVAMRKFDFHVHCGSFPQWDVHLDIHGCLEMLKTNHICGAVILSDLYSGAVDPNLNLPVLQAGREHKNLFPFHWVNFTSDIDTKQIDRQMRFISDHSDMIYGIKYHPSISQVGVNDDRLDSFWSFCRDVGPCGQIVLVHSGRLSISDGQRLYKLSQRFPEIVWIIAHLGGGVFDKIMECLYYYKHNGLPPNVYFDMSQTTHSILLERALDMLGVDRVIYGSDEPFLDSRLVMSTLEFSIKDNAIKNKIYFDNAAHLLSRYRIDQLE
jgi:hypothetical protein